MTGGRDELRPDATAMTHQAQLDFGVPLREQVNEARLAEMRAAARSCASDRPDSGTGHRRPSARATQQERLLALLTGRDWVPLPEILALGIAQFGARIKELRAAGHPIVNRRESCGGVVHSWYRLESKSE